jgi:hypothetical protein
MQTKIVVPRVLSVVDQIKVPSILLTLIQDIIKQKQPPKFVIDTFIDNMQIILETNLTKNSKNIKLDSYYLSHSFKAVFAWIETKYELRKEIKENINYFGDKLTPILLQIECPELKQEIFSYYLTKPKMGKPWDFFSQLPQEEQQDLFWKTIQEGQIVQKITSRNIDISKFQNKNRKTKGSPINLKERALKDFLYAHYQMRKSRTDFLKYVLEKLPNLEINYRVMNDKLHPAMIYPQNFYLLDDQIINNLNKNFYDCKLNKDIYKLNTEDAMLFHLMMRSGETMLNEGYFTNKLGFKVYDKDEFLKYFSAIGSLKELLPKFILNKADKAKSAKNKSFWRYLHINLNIDKNEVKPTPTKKMKI